MEARLITAEFIIGGDDEPELVSREEEASTPITLEEFAQWHSDGRPPKKIVDILQTKAKKNKEAKKR